MRSLFLAHLLCFVASHAGTTVPKPQSNIPSAAVMPLIGQGVDVSSSQVVTDALVDELMSTGSVRMMERSQMENILKEQGFQQSGICDGSECAIEIGKLLSIDRIFIGSLGKLGNSYTMSVRVVNIQTGEIIGSARRQQRGEIDDVTTTLVPGVAQDLARIVNGKTTLATVSVPTVPLVDSSPKPVAPTPPPIKSNPVKQESKPAPTVSGLHPRILLGATLGVTKPKLSLTSEDRVETKTTPGGSATIYAGVRLPMGKRLELDGIIGLSAVNGNVTVDENSADFTAYANYTYSSHAKATLTPQLVEIQGLASFLLTPRIAVGGGIVYSIPSGGKFDLDIESSFQTSCLSTSCTDTTYSDSRNVSGNIEDSLKSYFDAKPRAFASIELHSRFSLTNHMGVSASALLPIGDYISEKGRTATWSRFLLGFEYAFGTPTPRVTDWRSASMSNALASVVP